MKLLIQATLVTLALQILYQLISSLLGMLPSYEYSHASMNYFFADIGPVLSLEKLPSFLGTQAILRFF